MPGDDWLARLIPLCAVLIGGLLLLAGIFVLLMSSLMLRPARMSDARALYLLNRLTPRDLDLAFEPLVFAVRDTANPTAEGSSLKLAAWWLPCPASPDSTGSPASDRCVILLHGYADAKIGSIAWAPLWHSLGFNVLALDARAHGDSQGRYCTAGYHERHDLDAVIDQLRTARPGQTTRLVLFGISLGAATALATTLLRAGRGIDAVIVDCPYADFRHACLNHAVLLRLPMPALQRLALQLGQWRAHARFDEMRPVDLIPKMPAPLLVIQSGRDPLVPPDDIAAIRRATADLTARNKISEFWLLPEAEHVLALRDQTGDYVQHVRNFLQRASVADQSDRVAASQIP
jgi:uncharacterized protein